MQLASALGRSSPSPGPGSQRLPCPLGGAAGGGEVGRGLVPAANHRPPPKKTKGRAGEPCGAGAAPATKRARGEAPNPPLVRMAGEPAAGVQGLLPQSRGSPSDSARILEGLVTRCGPAPGAA